MAEETQILKIELDAGAATKNLNQLQSEIAQLAAEKRKLSKQEKELTKAIEEGNDLNGESLEKLKSVSAQQVENNRILKETKDEYRANERQIIRNNKANKANTGSLAEMRAELARDQQQYINLSKAERDNEKVGGALQKRIKSQSDELKKLEKDIGITSRSVGDYGVAVKGVLPLLGDFGSQIDSVIGTLGTIKDSLDKVGINFEGARAKVQGFASGMKNMGKSSKDTQGNMKASTQATIGFGAAQKGATKATGEYATAQNIANGATAAGRTQVKGFATAQKVASVATSGLSKALKIFKLAVISTGIGALVVALGSVVVFLTKTQKGAEFVSKAMAGIGAVVSVLVDRLASVGEALGQLFTGDITGAAETFGKATSGVTEEIQKEAKAAWDLQEALIAIEKTENDLILQRAATRAQVKELNKIAEDTTKGYAERGDAAKKAIAIEQNLLDQQVETQKKRAANVLGLLELTDEKIEEIRKNGLKIEDVGLSNSTEEERGQAIQEIAKIFELQESSLELQTTLQNKLNTIDQQRIAEKKKEEEDLRKRLEKNEKERLKALDELNKAKDQAAENDVKTEEEKFNLALETERKLAALRVQQNELQAKNLIKKEQELQNKLFELKKANNGKETAETIKTQDELNAVTQEKERVQGAELAQIKLENKVAEAEILGEEDDRLAEIAKEKKAKKDEEEAEELKAKEDQQLAIKNAAVEAGEKFVQEAFNNQNRRIDEGVQREVDALNLKREAGEISEEEFNKKRLEIDKKAFSDRKRLSQAQNAIDFAVAAGKTLAQVGFVAGAPLLIPLGIQAAAQAAIIASQKFAQGGVIHGASHANGGVNIAVGNSGMIEAEGGEAIINKKSTAKHLNLLSAINQDGGGVAFGSPNVGSIGKFANGGIAPSVSVQNESIDLTELRNTILEAQASIKVTNVASETTGVANRVQQIEDSASF